MRIVAAAVLAIGVMTVVGAAHGRSTLTANPVVFRGSIMFQRGPGGGVYAIDAGGGQLRLVVAGASQLDYVGWSPDGRRLAEMRRESPPLTGPDRYGLYVMRSNGAGLRRVTEIDDAYVTPGFTWSPDGRRIAYDVDSAKGRWINVIGVDGRGKVKLTQGSGPAWSPDGRWIAFLSGPDLRNQHSLFIVKPNGKGLRELVPRSASGSVSGPYEWSPDGRRIVFSTCCPSAGVGIVDVASARVRMQRGGTSASWSPDGKWLALGGIRVQLVRPDGSDLHQISTLPIPVFAPPAWSPDSQSLAVDTFSLDPSEIWVLSINGHRSRRLTQGWRYGYGSHGPQWQPANLPTSALGGKYVPAGNPSDSIVDNGTLEASRPIANLAADGPLIAIDYSGALDVFGDTYGGSETWDPIAGSIVRFGPRSGSDSFYQPGLGSMALANNRIVWGRSGSGAGTDHYEIDTATVEVPRTKEVRDPPDVPGNYPLADLEGHGSLLVFDSWDVPCRLSQPNCVPGQKTKGSLHRIDGTTATKIASSAGALTPLSVDAGRILVDHENGTLELMNADGTALQTFHVYLGDFLGAKLQGRDVVVLKKSTIADYDAGSGSLLHEWPLPGGDRTLADVQDGIAVYVSGTTVHLFRLADGREAVIDLPGTGPVFAQLEASGLFYSYTADDPKYPGRVVFVPHDQLPIH